jgi:hypothetical protein
MFVMNYSNIIVRLDHSRRRNDDAPILRDKQIDDMRDSLDYAFITCMLDLFHVYDRSLTHIVCFVFSAFYKNCILDLPTHRYDVDCALSSMYQEHYEDIDLTAFLTAMCRHLSMDTQQHDQ